MPLGIYARGDVNFAFISRHASRVWPELFDHPEDARAARLIELDPAPTSPVTCGTSGLREFAPVNSMPPGGRPVLAQDGYRFNFNKLRPDPFATAISLLLDWDFGSARGDNPSTPE